MGSVWKAGVSAMVVTALVAGSTAVLASPLGPQVSPQLSGQATDPWLALSMMNPAGAAALGGAAVAAAQPDTTPPQTKTCPDGAVVPINAPCGPQQGYTGPSTPPLPVIAIWLAVLGTDVYIATKNNHHHPIPNSPA